jgi:hypothetical protein
MTPYVSKFINDHDLEIFLKIKEVIEKLPDIRFGNTEDDIVSCHMLARALKLFFPVKVYDGYFCGNYRHSWLRTRNGCIIDVYPVAVMSGPILMDDSSFYCPSRKLYKMNRSKYNGMFSEPEFKRRVRLIRDEIKKILSNPELRQ